MPEASRIHIPLGADQELYSQMSSWAAELAGFLRFDLTPETPGFVGKPGLDLVALTPGDVILNDWYFGFELFDGSSPMLHVGTDLYPDLAAHALDSRNDWMSDGNVCTGDYLLASGRPKVWNVHDTVRAYLGDNQGDDPGSTQGIVTIVMRVLPPEGGGYPSTR